jgi:hypothetical protein
MIAPERAIVLLPVMVMEIAPDALLKTNWGFPAPYCSRVLSLNQR